MTVYAAHSDQELVALMQQGDSAAFTAIYTRYMELLYLNAVKRLKDEDEAEDLIHDLFVTVWEKRETLSFSSTLSAYL